MRKPMSKTVVLGLGNDLLADEGAGVHAVRLLQEQYPAGGPVEFLDGGTLSFTLAVPIADADRLIVLDAAQLGGAPGTVRVFLGDQMDEFLNTGKRRSVHEVGLIDLMAISRLTGDLPQQWALIGVQPQKLDWGDRPTPAVERAIPEMCRLAAELIETWGLHERAG